MHLLLMDDAEHKRLPVAVNVDEVRTFRIPSCNGSSVVTAEELVRLQQSVIQATKAIMRAKAHVRGMKTGRYLDEAASNIQQAMDVLKIGKNELKLRQVKQPISVCPEEFKGSTYGYPFFYKGFETTNCSYGKPIRQLVTVLLIYNPYIVDMSKLLNGIYEVYGNIQILIGTWEEHVNELKKYIIGKQSYVSIKSFSKAFQGEIWNSLIKDAKTPYIFIGRDITHFTNDSRLERLVRVIEEHDVDIAAGSSRDYVGRWNQNCYQTALKNYSLIYMEGYDVSLNECLFCDHTNSPFMIRTKTAQQMLFNENLPNSGLFEDLFLRFYQKYESFLVCPDSMFFTRSTRTNDIKSWEIFAETWNIYLLEIQPSITIEFPCNVYSCSNVQGYALSPCCLRELSDLLKFILSFCKDNNIICELQEGTLLGAVKFGKILPWERDGDLTFLTANFTALQGIRYKAEHAGYSLSVDDNSVWCCADNRKAGGVMRISSQHWEAQLWGQHMMDSELLRMESMYPTYILLDGHFVGAPRNPGLHARNRYGHDIYAHAQHWMDLHHESGWVQYKTRRFIPCGQKGRHECLDAYNGDGSIQFGKPIP